MPAIRHHYIDGGPSTLIADAPYAKSITKAASRIFAAAGETVPYCAAGNARDWTTADDAGFLPVQLQQDTGDESVAVGTFRDALAVFFPSAAQLWSVAVDPSANSLQTRLYGIGTLSPLTISSFANDLAFLSPFGVRSMIVSANTDRIDDNDIGVPIDGLVKADMVATEALGASAYEPIGIWFHEIGQYWLIIDMGTYSKVWAYSFSKTSKLACWSQYEFPIRITDAAALNGRVYVRTASSLYTLDPEQFTDDSAPIEAEVQMAFQDAKTPGVLKQFHAGDFVFEGTWSVSYKFDPRDSTKETVPQAISGDSRPGDLVPVEVSAPAIAPVFRHSADEAAEIDVVTLYYETLGLMG